MRMKNNLRFLAACAVLVSSLVLAGCTKDKFKTEPQVEIRSISPEEARKGNIITVTADVRDKEGDLHDSVLVVRKWFSGTNLLVRDTQRFYIGGLAFPVKQQIELQVLFAYGEIRDDALYIPLEQVDRGFAVGLIVRDKAGNRSPYVESKTITLKKL